MTVPSSDVQQRRPSERRRTLGRRGTVQESFLTETQEAVLKFLHDGTNQQARCPKPICN
jgi:hypothetical protein